MSEPNSFTFPPPSLDRAIAELQRAARAFSRHKPNLETRAAITAGADLELAAIAYARTDLAGFRRDDPRIVYLLELIAGDQHRAELAGLLAIAAAAKWSLANLLELFETFLCLVPSDELDGLVALAAGVVTAARVNAEAA